eukprot:CAMPEP_0174263260 /NCGR_PEP_ID=MMETSP0439-20130205/17869_1 /TAXON_ID=0 /ORGANISM="Stereomyxa ramosa, Strain Chinc5" /LENGTH=511 /DNA_ID=CAMNT_0015348513 /DNA_START=24 /DNA_END=1556 /DNA_ORIENTATION=+
MAADQGCDKAQYNMGVYYDKGFGVDQSSEKAFQYYSLAALQGYLPALYNLAWCYEHADGVPQDLALAVKYYQMAADKGHAGSLNNLNNLKYNTKNVGSGTILSLLTQDETSNSPQQTATHTKTGTAEYQKEKQKKLEEFLGSINPICLQHVDKFLKESLFVEDILELSEDDLKELNIPMGPRRKILSHIQKLNAQPPQKTDMSSRITWSNFGKLRMEWFLESETLKQLLRIECNGCIGELAVSLDFLLERFPGKCTNHDVKQVVDMFFSSEFLSCLGGLRYIVGRTDDAKELMVKLGEEREIAVESIELFEDTIFRRLVRGGVLWAAFSTKVPYQQLLTFSSPLSERYYFSRISTSEGDPTPHLESESQTLKDLILGVVSSFRSHDFTDKSGSFLKDVCVQRIFERQLRKLVNPDCHILALPSSTLPQGSEEGEDSFYIASLKWGIELVPLENSITNHVQTFGSKGSYKDIPTSDEIVVDLLSFVATPPQKDTVASIVFSQDFTTASVVWK